MWLVENGETHQVQLAAIKELFNRTLGVPDQQGTLEDDDSEPGEHACTVVASIVNRARGRDAGGHPGAPPLAADEPAAGSGNLQSSG